MDYKEKIEELLKKAKKETSEKSDANIENTNQEFIKTDELLDKNNNISQNDTNTKNAQNKSEYIENDNKNSENLTYKTEISENLNDNQNKKTANDFELEPVSSNNQKVINTDPTKDPIYSSVSPKTVDELNKYLDEVESSYVPVESTADLPEYLELTKKEMPTMTEEQIKEDAKAEADADYKTKLDQLTNEYQNAVSDTNSQKKTAEEKYGQAVLETNTQYDHAREMAENDALRRGLARSSIVLLQLSQIEQSRAGELSQIQTKLQESLLELESQLNLLSQEKEKAISQLDLNYAVELTNSINDKIAELEKTRNEVLEYNNEIAEIEHKYNIQVDEKRQEILQDTAQQTAEMNKNIALCKQNEQIALILNYFSQFNKERALYEFTKDSALAQKVGADVYYIVYRKLLSRTE